MLSSLTGKLWLPNMIPLLTHFLRAGYLLPNDETESDRLDVHHELIGKVLGGRLHVAPISENPQRVLDLCTGTGIVSVLITLNCLYRLD